MWKFHFGVFQALDFYLRYLHFLQKVIPGFHLVRVSLREKCPYSELFWSAFSRIWIEYGELLLISPYSVRMRENMDRNNSQYGYFSRSVCVVGRICKWYYENYEKRLIMPKTTIRNQKDDGSKHQVISK